MEMHYIQQGRWKVYIRYSNRVIIKFSHFSIKKKQKKLPSIHFILLIKFRVTEGLEPCCPTVRGRTDHQIVTE